jgi:hypothetical protein
MPPDPDPYTPLGMAVIDQLTAFTSQLADDLTGQRTYLEVKQQNASYALVKSRFANYNLLLWAGAVRPAWPEGLTLVFATASPDPLVQAA